MASKSHSNPHIETLGQALAELHEASEGWPDDNRYVRAAIAGETALVGLQEQLEAVTRVAEAAKTYRDVRGDYTWVQMIQALDAWEHPNPATRPEPPTVLPDPDIDLSTGQKITGRRRSSPAKEPRDA